MVRLDGTAFQDIGVDGALGEELDAVKLARLLFKYADELRADDLALGLRIGHARELVKKTIHGVHIDEVRVHLVAEYVDDLFGLALAEKPVVDVDTGELPADGLDEKRRDDGRIDAAGQGEKHLFAADLRLQGGALLFNKRLRQRGGGDAFHGFRTNIAGHGHTSQIIN